MFELFLIFPITNREIVWRWTSLGTYSVLFRLQKASLGTLGGVTEPKGESILELSLYIAKLISKEVTPPPPTCTFHHTLTAV